MKGKNPFAIQFGRLVAYHGTEADVLIPDSVTTIGRRAFFKNRTLKAVTIPASVTTIEQEAFEYCSGLETVTIRGKLQSVGKDAFGSFFQKDALQLSIYSSVPIKAFTKAAQEDVLRVFVRRYAEFDPSTEVFHANLRFLGTHLRQKQQYGGKLFYHCLSENAVLRHAVLSADAIPVKDVEWLIPMSQNEGRTDITAELLDYQNRVIADKKVRKSLKKSEEGKTLSAELSETE